jgi:S-adenosylmethionine-diacylgycerolhomoserine-N-methlytransferase
MISSAADHPVLMDKIYRRQRHIYDFTRKYYLLGRDRLIREMELPQDATVLEVGCGTARNLIKIAKRYPSARLFGLDISSEMLRTASVALRRAGLENRVTLRCEYAEHLSPSLFDQTEPFDAVVFSYSLSMIPDWKQALRSAARALKPGGRLHVVDFGDLGGTGFRRQILRSWLNLFHVEPREELLRTLEAVGGDQCHLYTLPGRYAFLFRGSVEALTPLP